MLISIVHSWPKHTDGAGSTLRVVLFNSRYAFDLIDHALLAGKLLAMDMPIFFFIDRLKVSLTSMQTIIFHIYHVCNEVILPF